jgi:hypothetical protein
MKPNFYGNVKFRKDITTPLSSRIFHGINQSTDEGNLAVDPECYSPKAANFETDGGNITCRKLYEAVDAAGISLGDGYTYKIKSLWVDPESTPILLAGVEAYSGETLHHCALLKRNLALNDSWAVVAGGAARSLGSLQTIYFSNADFDFANYSGDFFENSGEVAATILTNGADHPMFYYSGALYLLKSDGWADATASASADTITCASVAVNGNGVRFLSRTKEMPGGLSADTTYYVRDASGSTFKVAASIDGAALPITTDGANVMCRTYTDASGWYPVTAANATDVFTTSTAVFVNGNVVEFSSYTNQLPTGITLGKYYHVVEVSGATFKVSMEAGGAAIDLTSDGKNCIVRRVNSRYEDAPQGAGITVNNDRLLMFVGNNLHYNAGYYNDKANPFDWSTTEYAGYSPILTWDGDTINFLKNLGGTSYIGKENSVWAIEGKRPPYSVRQIFAAKGTIAPESVCWYRDVMFYATTEGIVQFNQSSAIPFLTSEIRRMWYADNTACKAVVVGDMMHIYARLYHPLTGTLGYGKLVVDLKNKDTFYHDMTLGAATLTVDATLDPWFTTLKSGVVKPEYWFASGDDLYKYGNAIPSSSAPAMTYYIPSTDMGDASTIKYPTWLYITGKGGTCQITPVMDNAEGTALDAFELPSTTAVVKVQVSGLNGRIVGWKIASVGGDPIQIHNLEMIYRAHRN